MQVTQITHLHAVHVHQLPSCRLRRSVPRYSRVATLLQRSYHVLDLIRSNASRRLHRSQAVRRVAPVVLVVRVSCGYPVAGSVSGQQVHSDSQRCTSRRCLLYLHVSSSVHHIVSSSTATAAAAAHGGRAACGAGASHRRLASFIRERLRQCLRHCRQQQLADARCSLQRGSGP